MIFSSSLFLFAFLPLSLALYYYLCTQGNMKVQNVTLLFISLVFYAWGEPIHVMALLLSIAVNYVCGLLLGRSRRKGRDGHGAFVFAVIFNVGLLCFFKHINFAMEYVNVLLGVVGLHLPPASAGLPIGISFFTLQVLSYIIDVHGKKIEPEHNPLSLALSVAFFPKLIAGPLMRYADVRRQITDRRHGFTQFVEGVQRFIIGLSKKVLIADTVAQFADMAFRRSDISAPIAWVGIIAYAIQIYFDFGGYSDMAIGLGKMFGFTIPENFRYPYMSTSIRSFWRRWHMTLSSWFRDYLYIPLGGSDKGLSQTYRNLLIVFLVIGLWHGVGWTFLAWGLFHGAFLVFERAGLDAFLQKLPRFIRWLYAMLIVLIGWVFFRAATLSGALSYLKSMFTFTEDGMYMLFANVDLEFLIALAVGIVGSAPILPWCKRVLLDGENPMSNALTGMKKEVSAAVSTICCIFLLLLSIVYLTRSDFTPFLYFRF